MRYFKCNMRVFVTVGSTQFDALVRAILSPSVLISLRSKGYNHVVVQCGTSNVEFEREALDKGLQIRRERITIDIWRFKPSLQEDFDAANLIISHAGTQALFGM